MPSQSARSLALARAVDRPTTRTFLEVWDEMKLVRDTITSSTGPLSSPGSTDKQDGCQNRKTVNAQSTQHQIYASKFLKQEDSQRSVNPNTKSTSISC